MDKLLTDNEPEVNMNNKTFFILWEGGGFIRVMKVHGGIAKQIQHC